MNKERILRLADYLDELPPEQFDMGDWIYQLECNTVACIAGWSCLLFAKEEGFVQEEDYFFSGDGERHFVDVAARMLLGLNIEQTWNLFTPRGEGMSVTPQRAAAVLRNFAETGEIQWKSPSPLPSSQ